MKYQDEPDWLRYDLPIVSGPHFGLVTGIQRSYGNRTVVRYRDLDAGVFRDVVVDDVRPATSAAVQDQIRKHGPLDTVDTPCARCSAGDHDSCVDSGVDDMNELACQCHECDKEFWRRTKQLRADGSWGPVDFR